MNNSSNKFPLTSCYLQDSSAYLLQNIFTKLWLISPCPHQGKDEPYVYG